MLFNHSRLLRALWLSAGVLVAPTLGRAQEISKPKLHVLKNGLRVLTAEEHSTPLVSAVWGAHVGDSAEPLQYQGSSHFLEHLILMRGTEKFPPNTIGAWVRGRGGYFNGHTWYDHTSFEISIRPQDTDAILDMHEQMMFHAAFGGPEFEMEKNAVKEEFRRRSDTPSDYLWDVASFGVYPKETFYSRGTIGTLESVEGATNKAVREYYTNYYVPNNMTLAVAGDFDTETLLRKIEDRFSKYSMKTVAQSPYSPIPFKPGITVSNEERDINKSYFLMGFEAPTALSADYFPLQLLAAYLSDGNTSLLRNELVTKKKLLDAIDVYALPRRFAGGWQPIIGEAAPESLVAGIDGIFASLSRIWEEGVPENDLDLAKKRLLNEHAILKADQLSLADELVQADCHGSYELFSNYEEKLNQVTAEDVLLVARKYFKPDHFFLKSFSPRGKTPANLAEKIRAVAGKYAVSTETKVTSKKLPNGGTVICEPRIGSPMESLTVAIGAGSRYDGNKPGLSQAVVEMATRRTAKRSRFALQDYLDKEGFLLSGETDRDWALITLQTPPGKIKAALALLREIVGQPLFETKEWEPLRKELIARVTNLQNKPEWIVENGIFERMAPGTPYANPPEGRPEGLKQITPADLRAFARERYRPDAMALAYVGGEDPSLIESEWGKMPRPSSPLKPSPRNSAARIQSQPYFIEMPGKLQLNLLFAWPAPPIDSKEAVYMRLVQEALGGGMSSRLWNLRQKEGLAYSIWGGYYPLKDWALAMIGMGTARDNGAKALAAIRREVNLIANKGLSKEELERAKISYFGYLSLRDRTAANRSYRLAQWWALGLPADYRARLKRLIDEAGLEDVNKVAASVLKPDAYWLVQAGERPHAR